jgi:hypothetical protein
MARAGQSSAKRASKKITTSAAPNQKSWTEIKNKFTAPVTTRESVILAIALVVVLVLGFIALPPNNESANLGAGTFPDQTVSKITGSQSLSENELRGAAALLATPIYWVGPRAGYRYVLDVSTPGLIVVRYIPEGQSPTTSDLYTAVGTYSVADAYKVTRERAEQGGNFVSVSNGDGAIGFYDSTSPRNVYLAFPDVDIQIEVFDPRESFALQAASTAGVVRLVN